MDVEQSAMGADTTSFFLLAREKGWQKEHQDMADPKISERQSEKPMVRTSSRVFSDGSILELIRIPNGELNFLIWDEKSANTAGQFVWRGETFVPPRLDPTILPWLHLPSKTKEFGSTRKLFTEIYDLISRTQVDDGVAKALSFFVFATWLDDYLPAAPFLWIVAQPTAATRPLLQVLHLLCRRSLVLSDISTAGFRFLPADLRPTLILEVDQQSRQLLNFLRASKRHGALIAANGKAVDGFGSKIVFARAPLRDPASAGFPLELVLPPTRQYIPLMSSSEAERIAAEYQAKLLRYRILSWSKVRTPAFDLNQFTVPVRETAHSLAGSIVDDDQLQSQIVPLLKPLDAQIRVDRTSLLPAIVLEVIFARCHTASGRYFPVGDMTRDVNTVLLGRGEVLEVSPEIIGWVLRGLGLHTDFMPGGRKALILLNDVRKKVHTLAAAYGVRTLREPAKIDCPLCATLKDEWNLRQSPGASVKPE